MSRKEKDLQKVIEEIKSSLQQKDLDYLNQSVLPKVDANTNLADLLKDRNIQDSLQKLMQNPNLASLLADPNLKAQISSLLNGQSKNQLLDQIKNALSTDTEKKKIDNLLPNLALLQQLSGDASIPENNQYAQKLQTLQALKALAKTPQQEKIFQNLTDYYHYKSLLDILRSINKPKAPSQPPETADEEQE